MVEFPLPIVHGDQQFKTLKPRELYPKTLNLSAIGSTWIALRLY